MHLLNIQPHLMVSITFYLLIRITMEQISSREANNSSAGQEILRLSWNPTFHYHIHKRSPQDPVLSQMKPAPTLSNPAF